MYNLWNTEHLKMKRTMGKRLVIIAPFVNIMLSLLSGALFYSVAMNWWYVFIFNVVIAIICVQIQEKEKKKLDYRNITTSPVPFEKYWMAKNLLAASYVLVSSLMVVAFIIIVNFRFHSLEFQVGQMLLAAVVMSLLSLYKIPIYMFLAKKWNMIVVMLTSVCSLVFGVCLVEKPCWYVFPMTWCNRAMYSVLGIMTNGLWVDEAGKAFVLSEVTIAVIVVLAVTLFFLFSWMTGKLAKKEEQVK